MLRMFNPLPQPAPIATRPTPPASMRFPGSILLRSTSCPIQRSAVQVSVPEGVRHIGTPPPRPIGLLLRVGSGGERLDVPERPPDRLLVELLFEVHDQLDPVERIQRD